MHPVGEPGERLPYAAEDVPDEELNEEWEQVVVLAENTRAAEAQDEAATRAILEKQGQGTDLATAADAVFGMSSEELGRVALEAAQEGSRGPPPR